MPVMAPVILATLMNGRAPSPACVLVLRTPLVAPVALTQDVVGLETDSGDILRAAGAAVSVDNKIRS